MTRAAAAEVPGILWIVQICKRAHIRLVPDILVIFGDNIQQKGYEGQAKECRGEPNALGISTKWAPAVDPAAFFDDKDILTAAPVIRAGFAVAQEALLHGQDVAYPFSGIGTGLAMLEVKAPKIAAVVHEEYGKLAKAASQVTNVPNLYIVATGRKVILLD